MSTQDINRSGEMEVFTRVVELGGAAPQIDAGPTAMTEQDGGHG